MVLYSSIAFADNIGILAAYILYIPIILIVFFISIGIGYSKSSNGYIGLIICSFIAFKCIGYMTAEEDGFILPLHIPLLLIMLGIVWQFKRLHAVLKKLKNEE